MIRFECQGIHDHNLHTRLAVLADLDSGTNDLVANAQWEIGFTPATSDGVDF
jgi:hypothetical protein